MIQKTFYYIFLIVILISISSCADKTPKEQKKKLEDLPTLPCKEVKIIGSNNLKSEVIKESIDFFLSTNCFINDKGVINLYISYDCKGNEVWDIYSLIENRHMIENASFFTPVFEDFNGDIVFIYDANQKNKNRKMTHAQKQKIRLCMDEIIGNRVYEISTRKDRWANSVMMGDYKLPPRGVSRGSSGTTCRRKIIFYEDGERYEEIINGGFGPPPCK